MTRIMNNYKKKLLTKEKMKRQNRYLFVANECEKNNVFINYN